MTDMLVGAGGDERMMTAEPCSVHSQHKPASHVNHRHHVWPLGMGGPDIADNLVVICPTGHMNVHNLLREFVVLRGEVPYSTLRRYALEERHLARLGFERDQRRAM